MARQDVLLLSVLIATITAVALPDVCPPNLTQDCLYTINIKTGRRDNAGTDSVIGVVLADKSGEYFEIKDLVTWGGKMTQGHDYFESGDLDIFSGMERCLPSPVCLMTLNSDGSANGPGWYVEYVNVTTTKIGTMSKHQHFTVDQWLAVDEPPHQLYTERSNCPSEINKSLYSLECHLVNV